MQKYVIRIANSTAPDQEGLWFWRVMDDDGKMGVILAAGAEQNDVAAWVAARDAMQVLQRMNETPVRAPAHVVRWHAFSAPMYFPTAEAADAARRALKLGIAREPGAGVADAMHKHETDRAWRAERPLNEPGMRVTGGAGGVCNCRAVE